MKVAIKTNSTQDDNRFRGIGFYTQNLVKSLKLLENQKFQLTTFTDRIPTADLYHFPDFHPYFLSFSPSLINQSIVTIHDLIPIEYKSHYPAGVKGNLRWQIQKQLLRNSAHIITDSLYSQKSIAKIISLSLEKITPIYLAPANNPQVNAQKPDFDIPEMFALYVGDLNWNKNIMMLAQTCVEIKLPLIVVGKQAANLDIDRQHPWNKVLAEFQSYAQIHPQIILTPGFVDNSGLNYLYQNAFAYICPSIAEGFGLPLLEAMVNRCPVITSNQTSLPEVSADACLYFNPSFKNQLIEQIQKLKRQKTLRRTLIKKGLAQVKKFSWQKTAQNTLKVYQEVYKSL